MSRNIYLALLIGGFSLAGTDPLSASPAEVVVNPGIVDEAPVYSPFVGRDYPDEVLFGDTHFHTELSFDAGMIGTRLDVDDAFRFARGEKMISNTGQPVQLVRPLDFLVITDHAEFMGLAPMIRNSAPELLADPWGRRMYDLFNSGQEGRMQAFGEIASVTLTEPFVDPRSSDAGARNIWREFVHKADEYYEPGRFTAMTGYEWTSTPNGNNQHRVVILADGADKTSQTMPFSMFDDYRPEGLWDYLASYEERTGGRAIAIPHNANLSNGLMFNGKMPNGRRMNSAYAAKRIRWEPLHEMSQMKGDEETHPLLSPDDEFADFENWDVSNILGTEAKEEWMLQYEYARSALKLGLKLGDQIGVNPYKHGLMAATDTHTGLATSREDNYFGKYQHTEPSADRHNGEVIPASDPELRILTSQEGASGLTAVWACENTREEIFGAMVRKEVYGTTGSRIRVRVFAGWDFEADEVSTPDFASLGYSRGVPMGGDLANAPDDGAPRFLVRALRDPDGANLDRVQVIKGWLDDKGETHERIYDIAVSGDRVIGDDGRAREPVGSTVDIETATFTNEIGAPMLAAHWQDPDFDPDEAAFYYIRVIEIPKPRWTTKDAAFFGVPLPDRVPTTVQDRAYTSPIWYTP